MMAFKTCKHCGRTLPLLVENFYFYKRDGYSGVCRACQNLSRQKRRKNRKNETKKPVDSGVKTCSKCGKILDINKNFSFSMRDGYNSRCRSCRNLLSSIYVAKNKKQINERRNRREKERRETEPEYRAKVNNRIRTSRQNNLEYKDRLNLNRRLTRFNKYQNDILYREEEKRKNRERWRRRIETNPMFKIRTAISGNFQQFFSRRDLKKRKRFFEYTGIEINTYVEHFKTDPLWTEYTSRPQGLHIDHIIPCAAYDFNDPEEIKKCWNPKNLRLLPAKENLSKSDKIDLSLIIKYDILNLMPKGMNYEF